MKSIGSVKDVVTEYSAAAASRSSISIADRADRQGNGRIRVVAIDSSIRAGSDSEIKLTLESGTFATWMSRCRSLGHVEKVLLRSPHG